MNNDTEFTLELVAGLKDATLAQLRSHRTTHTRLLATAASYEQAVSRADGTVTANTLIMLRELARLIRKELDPKGYILLAERWGAMSQRLLDGTVELDTAAVSDAAAMTLQSCADDLRKIMEVQP